MGGSGCVGLHCGVGLGLGGGELKGGVRWRLAALRHRVLTGKGANWGWPIGYICD